LRPYEAFFISKSSSGPHFPHEPAPVFFGHANHPDSLEASAYKAAWLDEAAQGEIQQQAFCPI